MNSVDKCVDALKKLRGLPPHNTFTNFCMGDGYFAASIRRDFTPHQIQEAERILAAEKEQSKPQRPKLPNDKPVQSDGKLLAAIKEGCHHNDFAVRVFCQNLLHIHKGR